MRIFVRFASFTVLLFFVACGSDSVSLTENIKGTWISKGQKITIRSKVENSEDVLYSDTLDVEFEILKDNTAKGTIGNQSFSDGKIKKNKGLPPHLTGVAYIIDCGTIGKLFTTDPLERKNVEIWISPLASDNIMKAELRYTDGMEDFPMANLQLTKASE